MVVRVHFLRTALGVGLVTLAPAAGATPGISVEAFVMKVGDDPAWSQTNLDDGDWQPIHLDDVPDSSSILWLRARVVLGPEHLPRDKPLAIDVAALASHEIWWDSERIGQGGRVGATAEDERPGPIQAHYPIPDRLASVGPHLLALRTSAFHRHFKPKTGYWSVLVGEYDWISRSASALARVALIALSGIVMMAIFALMMFLQDPRDKSFLFLGLLCLAAAMLLVAESWRPLFGYTYNWHLLRLGIVTALAALLDVFLLVFLARRFPMSGAAWFVGVGSVAALGPIFVSRSWDPKVAYGFLGVFLLATAWCLRASIRRLRGSVPALLGVGACLVALLFRPFFVERNLYLALDFLLVCLLGSHVLQVRQERKERDEALLKSARLEIELLKKHIQPHFMMNTLTALSEWIEEQPRLATRMIQSLSDEFRVLSEISNRPLIRMEDEIRLCRSHLEIMSHRKNREYRMSTEGVDTGAPIPPAVIHTLVENAITHNHYDAEEVEFRLSEDRHRGFRRYVFTSPLGSGGSDAEPREGTGLRYVRARLQESFGERFELRSRSGGGRWETEILVPEGT